MGAKAWETVAKTLNLRIYKHEDEARGTRHQASHSDPQSQGFTLS